MKSNSLTISNLNITLHHTQCRIKARVKFRINAHQSLQYAHIANNILSWQSTLVIPFAHELDVSTVCEAQYGFQEMPFNLKSKLQISAQQLNTEYTAPVYSIDNNLVGQLRCLIKIKFSSPTKAIAEEHESMTAKVVIHDIRGFFKENLATKNLKQHRLRVALGVDHQTMVGEQFVWKDTLKFTVKKEHQLLITLLGDQKEVCSGGLPIEFAKINKRFTDHRVDMTDSNHRNIGFLIVNMRCITKEEVAKMRYARENSMTTSQVIEPPMVRRSLDLIHRNKLSLSNIEQPGQRFKKVHIINSHNQIFMAKAKRFNNPPQINPHVSYLEAAHFSDFHKGNKGPSLGLGSKVDFTAGSRHVPGVGDYQLPSLWDKY